MSEYTPEQMSANDEKKLEEQFSKWMAEGKLIPWQIARLAYALGRASMREEHAAALETIRERDAEIERLKGNAGAACVEMMKLVSELYPGHDLQEIQSVIRATQDKYGTVAQMARIACDRASADYPKEGVNG